MEWKNAENQRQLWKAFIRYAQTHAEAVDTIPDRACVVLVPEIDLIGSYEELEGLLRHTFFARDTPVVYVYLTLSNYFPRPDDEESLTVTDARVEILASADDARNSSAPSRKTRRAAFPKELRGRKTTSLPKRPVPSE